MPKFLTLEDDGSRGARAVPGAADTSYDPAETDDWEDPAPVDVAAALDELAGKQPELISGAEAINFSSKVARLVSGERLWQAARAAIPVMTVEDAEAGTAVSQRSVTALRLHQSAKSALPVISQEDAEAGTATDQRAVTALRLRQAADAAIAAAGVSGIGITQFKAAVFTPTAAQILSDTPADADGSSIAITPTASGRTIIYIFACQQAPNGQNSIFNSWRFFAGGSEVASQRKEYSPASIASGVASGALHMPMVSAYVSTGTSEVTLKMQARRWSSTYPSKLHETRLWDAATSSQLSDAIVIAIELAP